MSIVLQTQFLNAFYPYNYGSYVSTIINVDPERQGSLILPIIMNESWGVEWKNVVIDILKPITLEYNESVRDSDGFAHIYDVKITLEVWYDTILGDPSLTFTYYLWNDGADDGYASGYKKITENITQRLNNYGVTLSRVKRVRYITNDGVKDYLNHPGNNFTFENFYRRVTALVETNYYILQDDPPSPSAPLSITHLSLDYQGAPKTFEIFTSGSWTVSDNVSWLVCSPTSGSGNAIITVDPSVNLKSTRYATITVYVNGNNETISVTQYDQNTPEM